MRKKKSVLTKEDKRQETMGSLKENERRKRVVGLSGTTVERNRIMALLFQRNSR